MSADLKECPFCGCMPDVQEIEAHKHNMKLGDFTMPDHPGCLTLECPTPGCCSMIADTKDELVAAWERRAIAPPVAAGSVDTPAFRELLMNVQSWLAGGVIADQEFSRFVAHIDAWGAQHVANALKERSDEHRRRMGKVKENLKASAQEFRRRAEKAEADACIQAGLH